VGKGLIIFLNSIYTVFIIEFNWSLGENGWSSISSLLREKEGERLHDVFHPMK
jgi:hypothetical protein